MVEKGTDLCGWRAGAGPHLAVADALADAVVLLAVTVAGLHGAEDAGESQTDKQEPAERRRSTTPAAAAAMMLRKL